MKKFLLFIFSLIYYSSFAQLDREHWFAPMYDGQSNGEQYQYLHLSTDQTTPFNVKVFNNNTVIAEATISLGNPAVLPIERYYVIDDDPAGVLVVGTQGLYVLAERPCFANLRFGVTNHAEIITSKGTAGIGTKFYTVMAPNADPDNPNLGFGAGFLATEDNTTVTVSNFKKPLTFSNGDQSTSLTFTFNKGESYLIDGRSESADQTDGFIGATVVSDKPISMSNGNFNGQYLSGRQIVGSDILMDQSVPVDKLGDEFVIVKGFGTIIDKMERAIVVATEPGTAVYLNDSTTPLIVLANAGDYYVIDQTNYVNRTNLHFNMHIKTTKNVYVYQLLAGVENGPSPYATGGMNYIPPLNCYLPKKVGEISYINQMSDVIPTNPKDRYTAKLNIITIKGAVVKVNGNTPNSYYGPYDISNIAANQTWVSYSIPEVEGNVTVTSTKAVTAGIASGNGAVGYGGYFAGFSSIPLILKTQGDCIPGVKLAVTEGFDYYQWLIKVGNTYVPAPGINNTFEYVPTKAGIYAVKIQEGICAEIQTKDFTFYNCTTYTNYDYYTCSTQEITPTFALSTQTFDPASLTIITPPTKGTLAIDANGKITYTVNINATGIDTFKYSFCGLNVKPECEIAQVTINISLEKKDAVLKECTSTGIAVYKLNLAQVSTDPTVTKVYYETELGAETQNPAEVINNFTAFTSVDRFVFVRITNSVGCFAIAKIELKSILPANLQPQLYTKLQCDEDVDGKIDGIYKVDFQTVTNIVLQNPTDHNVHYYTDQTKALAGGTDFIPGIFSFTSNTDVWIRVEPINGCSTLVEKISLLIGSKLILNSVTPDIICDGDLDGNKLVHLSDYISDFNNEVGVTATYFSSLKDAQNNENTIAEEVEVKSSGTYFFRLIKAGSCAEIGSLNLKIKIPKSSLLLVDQDICPLVITTLDAGPGFDQYLWSDGSTGESIDVPAGEYWVDLTFDGCTYRQNVSVKTVPLPKITGIEIQGGTVTVMVTGGNLPYQYSMNGYNYQTSNVFTNIPPGDYTVYVISADQCVPVTAPINVLRILNVITPNADGKNDILDYSDLLKKDNPSLQIFDRFGVSVFKGDKNNSFSWDGKTARKAVATGSYCYVMQWQEPGSNTVTKLTGWVLVKSRN